MNEVFSNDGSILDARNAYHETAKIPRVDMIQSVQDLNIESGFSDFDIQQNFNNEENFQGMMINQNLQSHL